MLLRFTRISLSSLIILSFILILSANKAEALSLMMPFGGKIKSVQPCTCPANLAWQITVGPPRPGVFMYKPGMSTLFSKFNIFSPGPYVVGIATGYSPCMQASVTGCTPTSTGGPLIRLVGTSGF